jgi:hypothetical protein
VFAALAWVATSGARAALAADWGTLEQALVCEKDFDASRSWPSSAHKYPYAINARMKDGTISADCKAEIERRIPLCVADPNEKSRYSGLKKGNAGMTREELCAESSFLRLGDQILNMRSQKEQAAARAKQEAAERAAKEAQLAKVELPTAVRRDPALEKQIAAAYKEAYPENKVLKVIIISKGWETERSGYGVITNRNIQAVVVNQQPGDYCQLHNELWMQEHDGRRFAGKLQQRGAGSQELTQILCSKAKAK